MASSHNIAKIAEILGIKPVGDKYPFSILESTDEGFVLVHYDATVVGKMEDPALRSARGVIIHVPTSTVVCSSFGYTPTVILSGKETVKDGVLTIEDMDDIEHVVPLESATFQALFEGTIIRVWKWNGVVYYSTHKRIDANRSRWGDSDPFVELYKRYAGPAPAELFDESKLYAAHTHSFLIVDTNVMMGSKMPIVLDEHNAGGFLVYLGTHQQFTQEPAGGAGASTASLPAGVNPDQVQWESRAGPWFSRVTNFATAKVELGKNPIVDYSTLEPAYTREDGTAVQKVQLPATFGWEMAKQVLVQGYYPGLVSMDRELHLTPGEAVLCRYMVDGEPRMLKLHSLAYQHRLDIVGNDPNMLHRAHQLLTETYFPPKGTCDSYLSRFPPLGVLTDEQFEEAAHRAEVAGIITPLDSWVPPDPVLLTAPTKDGKDARLRNALVWYAFCLPAALQPAAFRLYADLTNGRDTVISFICKMKYVIAQNRLDLTEGHERAWTRIRNIVTQTQKYAHERQRRNDRHPPHIPPNRLLDWYTKDNIRNLLYKEEGDSLYRITKAIQVWERDHPAVKK